MVSKVTAAEVERLIKAGATLIDTLPAGEYEREHIRGAINIPLREMTRESTAHLAKDDPVIVYCFDAE